MIDPAQRSAWPSTLLRRLGLDRNPLRRRSDRAETSLMAALLAVFLVGAPITAIAVSHVTHAATLQALRAQQQWHRVPAVLLESSPTADSLIYQPAAYAWVSARWTAPNGSARVGEVPAAGGTPAGTTVRVWVDGSGHVVTFPLTAAEIADRMVAAVVFAPIALAVVLLTLAAIGRRLLERRRMTGWEAAWKAIEPQWTHRV